MASTYLTRTPSSTGNRRKFTFSAWVKFNFNQLANNSRIFSCGNATSSWVSAYFNSTGDLQLAIVEGGNTYTIQTNRLFRDESAWYHLVFVVDTENATANYRLRIYVNGEEETSFSQRNNPTQNLDTQANTSSKPIDIGSAENVGYSPRYFPGIMSHVHMTDGYVYSASNFGSTDATTGEWKINTSPSVTYGTNGFFILKDGNSVTDQSGNSNNFSVGGGTLTKTEDNPSNVFATMNSLIPSTITYSNGNNTIVYGSDYHATFGTLGFTQGKWYYETKIENVSTVTDQYIGIAGETAIVTGATYDATPSVFYSGDGSIHVDGTATQSSLTSFSGGTILGVAINMDSSQIDFYINGVKQGTTETIPSNSGFYLPYAGGASPRSCSFNFGNGYFGSTQISSAGTNASGIGIFEYNVPANHTALSTKGLNE